MIPHRLRARIRTLVLWAIDTPGRATRSIISVAAVISLALSLASVSAISGLVPGEGPRGAGAGVAASAPAVDENSPLPVADAWAARWVATPTDVLEWRTSFTKHSTNVLMSLIYQVDPRVIEQTAVTASAVRQQSPTTAAVEVTFNDNTALMLTMQRGAEAEWRVASFEPIEGAAPVHDEHGHAEGGA